MRKVQVIYYDENETVYINCTFDASVDLQEAFMKLAEDITNKEDELMTKKFQEAQVESPF